MARPSERNRRIEELISVRLTEVGEGEELPEVPAAVEDMLRLLFATTAYGFREVVLTCLAAWEAGIEFDPREDFYKCNPRSVFERGVRPALLKSKIPHKKSGPLNVAKNIRKLDADWAAGRRPEYAALAAAEILDWLMTGSPAERTERRRAALAHILSRLLDEAARLHALAVPARTDRTLHSTFGMLMRFIEQAPDGGNTPQVIVDLALGQLHNGTGSVAEGGGRACETNLTAKKPADSWVRDADGTIVHLYEVTVKPIDENRVQDSADSVLAHGEGHNEVVWLCRMPQDIKPLGLKPGETLEYLGVRSEFVDLANWLLVALEVIGSVGRAELLQGLAGYVALPETSEKVKEVWKELQEE